jgi:putative transposase
MYLTAVMDRFSRKILARGFSNSSDAYWYDQVLQSATERYGCTQVANSEQGLQ